MTPAPRLRVTSVRYADPTDRARLATALARLVVSADPLIGTTRNLAALLVVGEPIAGYAAVVADRGVLRLAALRVEADAAGLGVETMLLRGVLGVLLDAGQASLAITEEIAADPVLPALIGALPVPDPLADLPVPIPAVSVIPLRESAGGPEVFVQYRVSTMDFAAGAVVFPGGRIDEADRHTGAALALPDALVADQARAWDDTAYGSLGERAAAARIVLATAVREVAEETGALIDPSRLLPWDDWITPIASPKRFDVRFFLYPVTTGESCSFGHTTTEAHRSEWVSVPELVSRTEDRALVLLPPTRTILDELAALGSVAAARERRPQIRAVRHDISPRRPRH